MAKPMDLHAGDQIWVEDQVMTITQEPRPWTSYGGRQVIRIDGDVVLDGVAIMACVDAGPDQYISRV